MSRNDAGRFQTGGNGGPGRPKGSRNKLSEEFLAALHDNFLQNGVTAIERMCEEDPTAYLRMIASLVPRQFVIDRTSDLDALSEDELDERIRELAAFLDLRIEPAS